MIQTALFTPRSSRALIPWERIPAPGAKIHLWRDFIRPEVATALLEQLLVEVPWRQDTIRMFGKEHNLPRLQQWYGAPNHVYRWSGISMSPLPWTAELRKVRDAVQRVTNRRFNSVLLNYYRSGTDTVSWHSDNEPQLGTDPVIASLSLGVERDFSFRQVANPKESKFSIGLSNGSLLVMSGETQKNWQHAVLRRKRVKGPRVNLTFRDFEKV